MNFFGDMFSSIGGLKKKFPSSHSDDFFLNDIKNTKLLSPTTKNIYLSKLKIIQNEFFDKPVSIEWVIKNPKLFYKALQNYGEESTGRLNDKLTAGSLSQFCVPIISIINAHREIQEDDPELLTVWKKMRNDVREPDEQHILDNKPSTRQRKGLITFEELCKVRDSLEDGDPVKILISLYTMIEPVRSNFDKVKIYEEKPNDNKNNYIVLGKVNKMFINKFKTEKYYDVIENDLPKELVKQIKISLDKQPREYLFVDKSGQPYDKPNTFNAWANRTLKKVLDNEAFTLTMFRHIYLSHLNFNDMTLRQRTNIANKMGHSTSQQERYIWKK